MSDHLKLNIDVLKQQTYSNFEVYFGDDLSSDNSKDVILENIHDDERFQLIQHKKKLFSMGNIAETIKIANPSDDDVVVLVDGDDSLADTRVLEYLYSVYESKQCWMTFGSYSVNGIRGENCSPYNRIIEKNNRYRRVNWRANHLKTFKYSLWKKVNPQSLTLNQVELDSLIRRQLFTGKLRQWNEFRKIKLEDLVTEDGLYVRRCSDKFLTLPLLEMAGEKAVYIDKILYHYLGPQGPLSFGSSSKKWGQRLLRQAVTYKPRYKRISELE